jgi:hypothetical protein
MNKYLILIILCFLPLYTGVSTGIKVALNDRLLQAMIKHFSPEINKMMTNIDIGDFHIWANIYGDDVKLHFPNNFMNYFKVHLSNNVIHVTCNGLSATANGDVRFSFWLFSLYKSLSIHVSNFSMDTKLRIVNVPLKDGGYRPSLEFSGDPDVNASIRVSSGGLVGAAISALANLLLPLFKRKIINMGVDEGKGQLKKIINNFEMKACIDKANNLWIDYSLINQVRWANNFIELNTYGLVYNERRLDTQKGKNGISFTDLPYLTSMTDQLQLYVSEYSINSAAKTFLNTFYKALQFKLDADVLNIFLPGFKNNFKDSYGDIILQSQRLPTIQITNQGLVVKYPHVLTVRVPSRLKPAYHTEIELTLGIDLRVEYGPTVYANINDLSAKLGTVYIKDATNSQNSVIEGGFEFIKSTVIQLFNGMAKNMKYKFPSVMGLSFKDLKFEFKDKYIVINYNLS